VYPFIGFEFVQDRFATAQNRDQIGKTEDFQMGLHIAASLGWADSSMGSDRDAAIFRATASRGFGSLSAQSLFVSLATSGRLESGNLANALLSFTGRYFRVQSKKRLLFAALSGTLGEALDLDTPVELGGKTGLRGYPLRYQVGESRLLMTLEQRYYTDWYPFNLLRVGGAVFVDIGRVWGHNPLGSDDRGWLTDIGFGLRLALTRVASEKVVHIDLAFPRNGDPTIDDVQLLVEFRRGF
jgi:hemolysin activation/secretion protein